MKVITNFFNKIISNYKYGLIMTLICIFIAIFDLVTKGITTNINVTVINGFLSFKYSKNTGAAWSILSSHTWLLILLSIIFLSAILIANWFYKGKNVYYSISLGLIIGGAICNLFDRIVFGYVRDFICLDFINFPIFNIADCAITIGVILLCIYFVFFTNKSNKQVKNNIVIDNKQKQQNEEAKDE